MEHRCGYGRVNACAALLRAIQPIVGISGVSNICTSNSFPFSLSNLPNSAQVQWSASPKNILNLTNTGNSVNVNAIGNGYVTLSATVTTACGAITIQSKTIEVGKPGTIPDFPLTPVLGLNKGAPYYLVPIKLLNPNPKWTYQWTANVSNSRSTSAGITLYVPICQPNQIFSEIDLSVNAKNACGVGPTNCISYRFKCNNRTLSFVKSCAPWLARTTPTRFILNQEIDNSSFLSVTVATATEDEFSKLFFEKANLADELIRSVKVYDAEGALQLDVVDINERGTKIDFSSLPEGNYNIVVYGNDDYREQQTYKYVVTKSEITMAEEIATGDVAINTADSADRKEVLQQQLYKELKAREELRNNSTILHDFFIQKETESLGIITKINETLANGDWSASIQLLNDWQPQTQQDYVCHQYYNYFLSYLMDDYFDFYAVEGLHDLAALCPLTQGEIVYAARSLYKYITYDETSFDNACDGFQARKAKKISMAKTTAARPQHPTVANAATASIYPNPSNGRFQIQFAAESKGVNTVQVINTLGAKVWQQTVSAGVSAISVQKALPKGIYLVTIQNSSTGKTTSHKLVVQ